MADNYLEKRYEEVFGRQSGKLAGSGRPSLDALISRCVQAADFDSSYKVHRIQLDALVSAAERAGCGADLRLLVDEERSMVAVCGDSSLRAGMAVQIMALKAIEMGLAYRLEDSSICAENDALAVLALGKLGKE